MLKYNECQILACKECGFMTDSKNIFRLIVLVVFSAFFLGAYLLESLGVQYVSKGGSPLLKIHIYSYMIMIGVCIFLLKYGFKGYLEVLGNYRSAWLTSFFCISFVICYGLYSQGLSGMAYLVDLIFSPLLFVPLVMSLTRVQKELILRLLAYLILFNACIAILEFAAGQLLIPTDFSDFSYFRSSALLGHPLNNALITASLTMLLMDRTRLSSIMFFFIVLVALFAFGGRGSVAIFLLAFTFMLLPAIKGFLITGIRVSKLTFALYQIGIIVVFIAVVCVLMMTSVGDRIFSKLYVDGSAQARFDVFILLEQLSFNEWLFGANESIKDNIKFYIGVNVIENYLIGWVISFGLFGAIPLFVSVFLLPIKMSLNLDVKATLALSVLFFTSITNNALSVKGIIILLFFLAFSCLLNKGRDGFSNIMTSKVLAK